MCGFSIISIIFPIHIFRETNLVLQFIEESHFKSKLGWVGAHQREKKAFLVPLILSERILFNIYVLSKCIVYWIHFQKIHTLKDNKTLIHALFYLFLKSLKAFSVSLSRTHFPILIGDAICFRTEFLANLPKRFTWYSPDISMTFLGFPWPIHF